jgi:hypothetical protein
MEARQIQEWGMLQLRDIILLIFKYPWFHSELQQIGDFVNMSSEDVAFCRALEAAGHPVHLDTKLRVGHQKKVII